MTFLQILSTVNLIRLEIYLQHSLKNFGLSAHFIRRLAKVTWQSIPTGSQVK